MEITMIITARLGVLGAAAIASMAAVASSAGAATRDRSTHVEAPYTRVESGRKLAVDAPYAFVRVNRRTGRVIVRAPFVDLDVPRR
jgi:hypothetical protein